MAAGPPPRGAAEAEPLLDTSARLVDIKTRVASRSSSPPSSRSPPSSCSPSTTGPAAVLGRCRDSRPSTSASPVHGMPQSRSPALEARETRRRYPGRHAPSPEARAPRDRRARRAPGRGCIFGQGAASSGRIGRAHRRGGRRGRDTADGDTDERIPRAPRIQRPNDAPGDGLGHADVPPPRSRRPGG